MPSKKFSDGCEIYEHCQRIGEHFGLYDNALFHTLITLAALGRRDQALARRHQPRRRHQRALRGHGQGPLNKPKLPGIPGIDEFKGHIFHTARWDYDYTGGDAHRRLDKLADKRVAIIGTGATAYPGVPHLGQDAKHLYVFQRTPSTSTSATTGRPIPNGSKSLKPGWQQERQAQFPPRRDGGLRPGRAGPGLRHLDRDQPQRRRRSSTPNGWPD